MKYRKKAWVFECTDLSSQFSFVERRLYSVEMIFGFKRQK